MTTAIRPRLLLVVFILWAQMGFAVGTAPALDLPVGEDLEHYGWRHTRVPGYSPSTYVGGEDGVLTVSSSSSFSLLVQQLGEGKKGRGIKPSPLSWAWRVERPPAKIDRMAEGDDWAIAVHVWFADEVGGGFFRRLKARAYRALGLPGSGRILTYAWGGIVPSGTLEANRHLNAKAGAIITLRSDEASIGIWVRETVDLAADYERAFGEPAPYVTHLAVTGDSDNAKSMSRAFIRDIRFNQR